MACVFAASALARIGEEHTYAQCFYIEPACFKVAFKELRLKSLGRAHVGIDIPPILCFWVENTTQNRASDPQRMKEVCHHIIHPLFYEHKTDMKRFQQWDLKKCNNLRWKREISLSIAREGQFSTATDP